MPLKRLLHGPTQMFLSPTAPPVLFQASGHRSVPTDWDEVYSVEGSTGLDPSIREQAASITCVWVGFEPVKERRWQVDLVGRFRQRLSHADTRNHEDASEDMAVEAQRASPSQQCVEVERGSDEEEVCLLLPGRDRRSRVVTPTEKGPWPANVSELPNARISSSIRATLRSVERLPETGSSPKTHRNWSTP